MNLLTAKEIYETENSMEAEVVVLVNEMKVPARVTFKKVNEEYHIQDTGWMQRYDINPDSLGAMILEALSKQEG